MTLLTIEGFESRTSRQGWTHANMGTVTGRFGGYAADRISTFTFSEHAEECVVGFAYKTTNSLTRLVTIYGVSPTSFLEDEILHFRYQPDGRITLHRNSGSSSITATPIASGTGPTSEIGSWVYLEFSARLASVGGYVNLRVNGVPYLSLAGDTMYGNLGGSARALFSRIEFTTATGNFDDIYICDRLGTEFNDFLGEIRVESLSPNGNGVHSQWVGSDGNNIDNYALVDEIPISGSDFVQSNISGNKDSYQFQNLATAQGQILAVQPTIFASKINAGPASVKTLERLATGTERKSPAYQTTNLTSFGPIPQTRDPEGAVWTVESVNSSEFGVEVL